MDGEEHKGSGIGYRAAIPGLQQTASYTRQDVRSVPGTNSEFGVAMTSASGPAVDPDKMSVTGQVITAVAVVVFFLALLVGLWYWPSLNGTPKAQQCAFNRPAQSAGPVPTAVKPAKLVPADGQITTLPFDRGQVAKTLTIRYNINGTIPGAQRFPNLKVDQMDFLRYDNSALPASRVKVAAWYQSGHVVLKVCFNRSGSKLADPGIYQSTVSIVDPRITQIDTQVTITLNYPNWTRILVLLALAAFAGTWYIWILRQKTEGEHAISLGFFKWCGSMLGVLSIAAGTIAAFTIYNATYLRSDSWGSSMQQPIALLGAMFTAFVAGAATVHIGAAAGEARAARREPAMQKAARLDQEADKRHQEADHIRKAEADRKAEEDSRAGQEDQAALGPEVSENAHQDGQVRGQTKEESTLPS